MMPQITSRLNRILGAAVALACVATIGTGLIPKAVADEGDKKTIVTFSAPVEVPGKALPAGTYVFKLLDSTASRHIVQIFDKDETKLYATILAIPDYRMTPPDKPIIQFEERASGAPPALKAWFYPGDNFGQQFVYPHERAVQLAKRTNQHVLSMGDEMTKHITAPVTSASHASARQLQQTDVTGVRPSGESVALAVVVGTKPQ